MFKFIFALLAALAAVSFPIYFVIFLFRLTLMLIVGPIVVLLAYVGWLVRVWAFRQSARKPKLLTH